MHRGPAGKLKRAAWAAYTRIPSAQELQREGGLYAQEDYFESAEVWPENWAAWQLFMEMDTQWRTAGMAGVRYGLDYGVLMARLDRIAPDREQWEQLFNDVRVLEVAALNRMAETAA